MSTGGKFRLPQDLFTLNPIVRPASLPGIWHSGVQGASKELVNLLWFLCGFSHIRIGLG